MEWIVQWFKNTMVIRKFLKDRVVGPLPFMTCLWLINGGDPNCLLTGVILREGSDDAKSPALERMFLPS